MSISLVSGYPSKTPNLGKQKWYGYGDIPYSHLPTPLATALRPCCSWIVMREIVGIVQLVVTKLFDMSNAAPEIYF